MSLFIVLILGTPAHTVYRFSYNMQLDSDTVPGTTVVQYHPGKLVSYRAIINLINLINRSRSSNKKIIDFY